VLLQRLVPNLEIDQQPIISHDWQAETGFDLFTVFAPPLTSSSETVKRCFKKCGTKDAAQFLPFLFLFLAGLAGLRLPALWR
jgi:hypothetical protein